MTSELLDWYEEGTWTATMVGSTAAPTTPVTATGYYTRVGNIVHVFASFANVDTTGATGDLQVTGLPFTSGASRAFGMAALDKFVLNGVQAFAAVYNGSTTVVFSENVNNGYGPNVAIPSTTGVYAQFSITYQV
jgi:formate hydrogenlyase subunit 4